MLKQKMMAENRKKVVDAQSVTVSIKSDGFAFPGVCSPVEAGEVARIAWRRGGDLPRGLHYVQDDSIVERKRRISRNGILRTNIPIRQKFVLHFYEKRI